MLTSISSVRTSNSTRSVMDAIREFSLTYSATLPADTHMLLLLASLFAAQADATFEKWEKEIAAIEKKHADAKPCGVAFVGSSTIRFWDVKKSFPDWNAYNCGFGGSEIRHSTYFAKRII